MAETTHYVVQSGDTLNSIVKEFGSSISGSTTNDKIKTLCDINHIKDADVICIGQVIYFTEEAAKNAGVTYNQGKTALITAFGFYSNKEGKLYVSWEWDHGDGDDEDDEDDTDHYEVRWRYYSETTRIWYDGEDASVSHRSGEIAYNHIYDYSSLPDDVTQIRVSVTPIAKTVTEDDTETELFSGIEAVTRLINIKTSAPPPKMDLSPTYELTKENNKNILKITLTNLSSDKVGNATKLQFKLWEQSSENSSYIEKRTKDVTIIQAETTCTFDELQNGYLYKVQYRGIATGAYGEWSDFSDTIAVSPTAPEIEAVIPNCYDPDKTTQKNGVEVIWVACDSAKIYNFEFLALNEDETKTPEELFNQSNYPGKKSVSIDVEENTHVIFTENSTKKGRYTFYDIAEDLIGKRCYVRCCSESKNSGSILGSGSNSKSNWSKIVEFVFGTTPDFPTTWHSQTNVFPGDELKIFFTHNSQDGSQLTDAEIKFMVGDGERTYMWNVIGAEPSYIKAMYKSNENNVNDHTYVIEVNTEHPNFASGATILYQICTGGIYEENGNPVLSEFSPAKQINIYTKPTLALGLYNNDGMTLLENGILTSFPLKTRFGLGKMTNQNPISYHLSIVYDSDMYDSNSMGYEIVDNIGITRTISKGSVVYSKNIDSVNTDVWQVINANDVTLKNDQRYIVKCVAYLSSGLTVTASDTFSVSWVSKAPIPFAEIGLYKDNLTAHIKPYANSKDVSEPITFTVYRKEFDGSFVQIGSSIQNVVGVSNEAREYVIDPHPALSNARYRIVAKSETTGAIEFNDISSKSFKEHSIVLQWDEVWTNFYSSSDNLPSEQPWAGSMLKLPYNISISNSYKPDVSTVNYIGRKHPVSYYGTQTGETATWSVDIPKNDLETLYAIRRLSVWMGDVYVREPSGTGYWANVSVSFSQKSRDLVIPVTFNITRVEGGI